MELKTNVVYQIKNGESWRSKESIDIKSNLDEEMVECRISKSLVDYLRTESAMLEPDKLLLHFAEVQKREIKLNLESLDDMTLRSETLGKEINKRILKTYSDNEKLYEDLQEKFEEVTNKFRTQISLSDESLDGNMKILSEVSEKLEKINSYSMERIGETLKQLIDLVEKDPELVKIVFKQKLDESC